MDIKAVQTSYARWAPIYDRTFGAITNVGRRRAVAYVNRNAEKVLEVGVGTGLSLPFYSADVSVTGIDFCNEMLAKARAKVVDQNIQQVDELRQMDARTLDYPDDHFDVVVALHIMSVVPDPERVIAEMARVCKPGGKVVITNHFARKKGFLALVERLTAPFENLLGWQSDFEMDRVLQQKNLSVIEQKSFPPMGMMTFLAMEKAAA